jgi:DnaD/phage-associated family protein
MDGFAGFPDGNLRATPVPALFFSELLPMVDDLVELKVTLHCLWLCRQKGEEGPYVTASELEADELLQRSLLAAIRERRSTGRYATEQSLAREALREGLERAVARGTLLQVSGHGSESREAQPRQWYFLNSERGRAAVRRIERGEWAPKGKDTRVQLSARRPNIYNLYEQNVGMIHSPILAEELREAEETYPAEWIEEAFRIAVGNNVRRWAYVRRILERWAEEGRGERQERTVREESSPHDKGGYEGWIKE